MQLAIDGWHINVDARTAKRSDITEQLSPRAVRLLQVMTEADGAVLSRTELLDRVWPNVVVGDESLTQVVSELRRKLANRDLIATVARGGYRMTAPVLRIADTDMSEPATLMHSAFSLDAYTLYIEAQDCFNGGLEGSQRAFVDLAAQAAALAPGFAEARSLHALALLKRHIFWSDGMMLLESALQECEAAKQLNPKLASAHLTEAAIRIALGHFETGIHALEKALSLAPDDAGLHLEAAILILSTGNRRTAAALAIRSAMLDPRAYAAEMLAARIFQYADPARGRLYADRALRKIRAELMVDPASMRALYALGPLLAQLGNHRAARSTLEGIAHHDSPLEYYRAIGFAQIGDTSAALERLDFLALRGWRHACILDKDDGLRPMHADQRLQRLQADILAA